VITEDMKDRIDVNVSENGRFTLDEVYEIFLNFRHLFSTRLSQSNSDTEKFVSNEFHECSQMNTSTYGLVKWSGGRLLRRGARQACATSRQMPGSQWGLRRKRNMYCIQQCY
jgi:hypothetical protein